MINSKPNNKKYHQGNYIPENKEKVLKLNVEGGVYYRSSWEKIIYRYLDINESITQWSAEGLSIPYQRMHRINGVIELRSHTYYPDIVYTQKLNTGEVIKVVAEIKPMKEYEMTLALSEGTLTAPKGIKKLRNFEYAYKQALINKSKWETAIKWCEKKGYHFIIITEKNLSMFNIRQPKK